MTRPTHRLDRRTFLRGGAVIGGALVAGAAPSGVWARPAHADEGWVRTYVVVVDGLRPDQVERMPALVELAEHGAYFPESRAQMVAETTPNHVSMFTGMRADRNGMPGNGVPGLDMRISDDRRYLKADSLFTLAARQAPELTTAAVTAKTYIVESTKHDRTASGTEDATHTNDPTMLAIPMDDSARDAETGALALRASRELDPDFLFVNLGDVDRAGHVDLSGGVLAGAGIDGSEPAFQRTAIAAADQVVRSMITELKASGRWQDTVVIVTADHAMDWSFPDRVVDLADAFEADDLLCDEVVTAVNGGAALYALRSPDDPDADERLRRMRSIALAADGVRDALYLRPNPLDGGDEHFVGRLHPDWGLLGDYTGELIVTVEEGWRIGHGGMDSNPIPGNHGHPSTLPIPVIVGGGWSGIRQGAVTADGPTGDTDRPPNQAENIDIAPTVAWLLGLNPPPGGFDGKVLTDAFLRRPAPRVHVDNVVSMPALDDLGGADPYATAVALSREALPDGYGDQRPSGAQPLTTGNETVDDEILGQLPLPEERTVVIASGQEVASALTAGPLAASLTAPLLLARAQGLPSEVAEEVARLEPDRALLVGSTAELGSGVEQDLRDAGVAEVERLDGQTPPEVAASVARRMGVSDGNRQVVLTAAHPPSMALAAQPAAALRRRPVLLTDGDGLPTATTRALGDLEIDRVMIVGDDAVVAADVEAQLREAGRLVERIDGDDADEVGRRLVERAVREGAVTDDLYLAPATPAALALGPAVSLLGGSLLLVEPDRLGDGGSRRFIHERADELVRVRFVGALTPRLRREVEELVHARRTRGAGDQPPSPPGHGPPDHAPGPPDHARGRPNRSASDERGSTGLAGLGLLPSRGSSVTGLAAMGLVGALGLRRRPASRELDGPAPPAD